MLGKNSVLKNFTKGRKKGLDKNALIFSEKVGDPS